MADTSIVESQFTIDEQVTAVYAVNLLDQVGLIKLWELVQAKSKSATLPYHNEQHLLNMVAWCGKLYLSESKFFDRGQLKLLLAAACLHDVDHSGGLLKDSENIQNAYAFLDMAVETIQCRDLQLWLQYNSPSIKALIRVTEFPFVHSPTTSLQKILRDADILQNFSGHCVKYLKGLWDEFTLSGNAMTSTTLIERQDVFMREVVFYTYTGNAIKAVVGPRVFNEQKQHFLKEIN